MANVADVMSTGLLTVSPRCSARAAARMLLDGGVNLVPVTSDEGALLGAVSTRDLLAAGDGPEAVAVEAVMQRVLCQASPSEDVCELAERMLSERAHHALVSEQGLLIGVVSSMDLMACLVGLAERVLDPVSPDRDRRRRGARVLAVACNHRRLAEACGERYQVKGVDSLEEGSFAAVEAGEVDLLVISDKAPGFFDVLRGLRSRFSQVELPILAMIDVASPAAVLEAHAAGASDTVGRGASPDELRAKCGLLMACFKRQEVHGVTLPGGAEQAFGRYQVSGELGSGGYGVVYKAHDCVRKVDVALKVLLPGRSRQREARYRFLREFYALSTVNSPFVVRALDSGLQEGRPYLAMEYVTGPSLEDVIESGGALDEASVLDLLEGLIEGIATMDRAGLLHRDIKPANVILRDGKASLPVLVDLGLAKRADDNSVTALNVIVGSPHFLSPERIQGRAEGVASELFTLGLLGRYALEGHPLFPRLANLKLLEALTQPLPPLRRVSPALTLLLERLSALHPADRCQSAEEALAELERARATLSGRGG